MPETETKPAKPKSISKTEIVGRIASKTGLKNKDVAQVYDALVDVVREELSTKQTAIVALPGLLKIEKVYKPAVPAHSGVNKFTGQPTEFKAKPEKKGIKLRALKALKEMAEQA